MDFRTDKLLHGGDYNPEQWLKRPDILEKDIDMLEESGCNVVSLGIFSWSTLEPEEGVFHFGWLQEIIDKLYKRAIHQILMNSLETFFAIVIICIDDDERGLDDLLRCKHGLTGSPRLCTAFRQSPRNIVNVLESIIHRL